MPLDNIVFTSMQLNSALQALGLDTALFTKDALACNNISLDSRDSDAKTAFIALKGSQADGHDYIHAAIQQTCRLVLCERLPDAAVMQEAEKASASIVEVADLRAKLPILLGHLFLVNTDISVSAVTGTNGKTSVAFLYAQLGLSKNASTASLGTLGLNVLTLSESASSTAQHIELGVNTTPDIVSNYKVMRYLANNNISEYCLEASSHGIEQGRLAGLPINTAIFTNLTQDHLDYHGNMHTYALAKRGLLDFKSLQYVVLNADDEESKNWAEHLSSNITCVWYGVKSSDAKTHNIPANAAFYCTAQNLSYGPNGIEFELDSAWGQAQICLPLFGAFNVSNALAAFSAQLIQGKPFEALVAKFAHLKGVPGRMELFGDAVKSHANLIVDYAHTPDALKQSLVAARKHAKGKLFCVFGCGGDRDKSKRPLMGQAASLHSDVVVITQDNSRTESPAMIAQDVMSGIDKSSEVHIELDRKEAIRWAYNKSSKQDLILVAGKGHETYLEINHQRIAYDERDFVQQLCTEAVA